MDAVKGDGLPESIVGTTANVFKVTWIGNNVLITSLITFYPM